MKSRCQTAILISGSGTNLQAFIDAVQKEHLDLDLAVVFSNNPNAYGLERAEQAGIPTACIQHSDFADRESFDQAVISELDRFEPDLLILAGFMRILSPAFVAHYSGKILNIHPALLPGVQTVAVATGSLSAEELKAFNPTYLFPDLSDTEDVLARLLGPKPCNEG